MRLKKSFNGQSHWCAGGGVRWRSTPSPVFSKLQECWSEVSRAQSSQVEKLNIHEILPLSQPYNFLSAAQA